MKVTTLVWSLLAAYCLCSGPKLTLAEAAAKAADSTSAADASDSSARAAEKVDPANLEAESDGSETDPFRTKRQHDAAGNPITGLISSVFNKKLGLIGSLSSLSSSSKGAGVETHHHTYEYTAPPPAKFDWFSFKKSILASLLQAVKAITGGVIALNGQLVKVKGHIMAAKGHLLATKGDSITAFGKHVATHAFSSPGHADIHEAGPPSAPSGSGSGYGLTGPANFHSSLDQPYPHNDFKEAIEYPGGYYKESGTYSKRAAPIY